MSVSSLFGKALGDQIVREDRKAQHHERGDPVDDGMLLKKASCQAYRQGQKHGERAKDTVLKELAFADENAVTKDERVVDVDARENIGRRVDLVKVSDHLTADVVSRDAVRAKEQFRREHKRDNDEKAHADHEKSCDLVIGILVREKRPQAYKRDPRKPHDVRDDERGNKRDVVIERYLRNVVGRSFISFYQKEKYHIDAEKDQHRRNYFNLLFDVHPGRPPKNLIFPKLAKRTSSVLFGHY